MAFFHDLLSFLIKLPQFRNLIVLGLILQSILIILSPLRKKSSNGLVTGLIWISYTLANVLSSYMVGLVTSTAIAKRQHDSVGTDSGSHDLIALWAPYILLQVVGPDTITATTMDDNKMWARYAIQFSVMAYILHRSMVILLPRNMIGAAMYFVFAAGIIKYVARIRSLYFGNLYMFRNFNVPVVDTPRKCKLGKDTQVVGNAFFFFKSFKGIFANAFSTCPEEKDMSRNYFLQRGANHCFAVVEAELNLAYDILYTKSVVLRWKKGFIFRVLAVLFELATLIIWVLVDKHGFNKADIRITWALVLSAFVFDGISSVRLLLSDWTFAVANNSDSCSGYMFLMLFSFIGKCRCVKWLSRRWSETVPQYSFIKCCTFPKYEGLLRWWKMKDWLQGWRYIGGRYTYQIKLDDATKIGVMLEGETLLIMYWKMRGWLQCCGYTISKTRRKRDVGRINIRNFIFEELKFRSEKVMSDPEILEKMFSGRGDWALRSRYSADTRISNFLDKDLVAMESRPFEDKVLIWHIATELCYNLDDDECDEDEEEKKFLSKVISGYMLYIVLVQPAMVFGVTGESKLLFQAACDTVTAELSDVGDNDFKGFRGMVMDDEIGADQRKKSIRTCEKILILENGVIKSATLLAAELKGLRQQGARMWEVMSSVWAEMMFNAASNSNPNEHAAQLCKGGELLTVVWLLMAHMGLGKQLLPAEGDTASVLV